MIGIEIKLVKGTYSKFIPLSEVFSYIHLKMKMDKRAAVAFSGDSLL